MTSAFQIWRQKNFSPHLPGREPKMCISGTEARIGKRISNLDRWWRQHSKFDVRTISHPNPPAESQKCVSRERKLRSENGFQIWIADDVSIPNLASEKFLALASPADSQKCVSRERKLGSENGFQIWIGDDDSIPNLMSEQFLTPTPPAESQKCVSRKWRLGSVSGFQFYT